PTLLRVSLFPTRRSSDLEERQYIGDGQTALEHRAEHRLLGLGAVRRDREILGVIGVLQVIVGDPVCDAVDGGHDCWSPRSRSPRDRKSTRLNSSHQIISY